MIRAGHLFDSGNKAAELGDEKQIGKGESDSNVDRLGEKNVGGKFAAKIKR